MVEHTREAAILCLFGYVQAMRQLHANKRDFETVAKVDYANAKPLYVAFAQKRSQTCFEEARSAELVVAENNILH